jgi:catechol 2,3-dioxygenase-like lactoylglutathione lyase family enzyme
VSNANNKPPSGFIGLNHAAIGVADLKRALEFYTTHLGFTPYYEGDADWAMVRMGNTTLSLLRQPALVATEIPESYHPSHLGVTVESKAIVETTWERFQRTLDGVVGKPKLHRDGSYGFYFQDTEGNTLEIIYIPNINS